MEQFTVALAQLAPKLLDKESNLVKAENYIRQAASQQAAAILFPELYLTGYSLGKHAFEVAETIEGSSVRRVAEMAARSGIAIVMGFAELAPDGKHAYDACFAVNAHGQLSGCYRKTHLFQAENGWFLPGEAACVIDFGLGSTGMLICYDLEFPEAARDLALRGAQWIVTCTGNMTPNQHLQEIIVQTRAAENRLWVALANRVGSEDELTFFGCSTVADPNGNIKVQGGQDEGLFFAQVDLSCTNQARLNADYLSDRRPELYGTLLNQGRTHE